MTVAAGAMVDPLTPPRSLSFPFIDASGALTPSAVQFLQEWRDFLSGVSRTIPCDITGTNLLTLAPITTAPRIKRYNSYDIFVGRAAETSTGTVTATVLPDTGELATLPVYKTNGTAAAGAGDVVADSLYLFVYADFLNGGDGGFVLK